MVVLGALTCPISTIELVYSNVFSTTWRKCRKAKCRYSKEMKKTCIVFQCCV